MRFVSLSLCVFSLFLVVTACGREEAAHNPKPASGNSYEPDAPNADENKPVDVQVTKPSKQLLVYSITLPANIAPLYQTTLYAKVSGYLKWIGPDKGDTVKKNQVVAVIDAPEVEEQYLQAMADYKIKKITFDRLMKVWNEAPDVIAKQDVDVAEAAYEGARNLMQQRAVLRDYTKVRAPYDGIITARFADPGALIQVATSSATTAIPLFTIMDLDTVRVYASVPQDESPWVVAGKTKASVTVTELPDRSFSGTVTRSTLALDPSTRSLLIEVDLPNGDHALKPGTYAEMTVDLREIPDALVLPPLAVTSGPSGHSVFIVEQGKATSVPIRTGITSGKFIEIVQGLNADDEVVVVGKRRLLEGSPVHASPYHLPEAVPARQRFERKSAGLPPAESATVDQDKRRP
ncbi:putative Membrane-fusion protein of multidrug efflux transporter [Nitrospira japonica]|uniref:Putative Membrane-fusion protein of multidrug efflux transporter n=1 Tax=Nitrospira japonica TaxID=1325564 RepID=A0A1W1I9K2_9BACT|nr:efflux RND transporter periplasmic adaptor subunit [Nitrospira japonica]SLM49676.1 putative Membrane-fusion protein of multidrug efflux transporter [Nitrospira japonica]